MKEIPITKLTSYGNSFVVVDETQGPVLSEREKSAFAEYAIDRDFGIGADNLLVVQRATPCVLDEIRAEHGYWGIAHGVGAADFIFRMFEPDGSEAYCCGNGLMCIAKLLHDRYGITRSRIITEIPLPSPNVVSLGFDQRDRRAWVDLGLPRRSPPGTIAPDAITSTDDIVDLVSGLRVHFREHDLADYTGNPWLDLNGYLVFTGEPHFVVFTEEGVSEPCLFTTLFGAGEAGEHGDQRGNFGGWLLERVGFYFNHKLRDVFPDGINVNFARIQPGGEAVEYRCFERGIERETLSCGTGALAVAFVAARLGLVSSNPVEVVPYRCCLARPASRIMVDRKVDGWALRGEPLTLMEGAFRFDPYDAEPKLDAGVQAFEAGANVTSLVGSVRA